MCALHCQPSQGTGGGGRRRKQEHLWWLHGLGGRPAAPCLSAGSPKGSQDCIWTKASSLLLVCRPRDGSAGPVWCVPGPPVPGILRVPPGLLCQGPQPPGKGPEENPHSRQLARLLHLPPGECGEWSGHTHVQGLGSLYPSAREGQGSGNLGFSRGAYHPAAPS